MGITLSNRIGETNQNIQGFTMKIIEYYSAKDVIIEFNDKYNTIVHDEYIDFKRGKIHNPSYYWLARKFLIDKNDVSKNPIAYQKYRAMIDRCYGKQKYNNIVYKGCKICEEWNDFNNFVKWFNDNYYEIENESMELDKDLFGDGKLYSPQTCVFMPHKLNSWIATKKDIHKRNTNLPMGVSYYNNGYGKIRYRVVSLKEGQLFDDINEAANAYKRNVEKLYKDFAEENKNIIPIKLYNKLINYKM